MTDPEANASPGEAPKQSVQYNLKACTRCGHKGGSGFCEVCHGGERMSLKFAPIQPPNELGILCLTHGRIVYDGDRWHHTRCEIRPLATRPLHVFWEQK